MSTSAQLRTETSTFQWGQCVSRDVSWARLKHGGDNIPLTNWFRRMGHYTHLQDIPRTAPELSAEPLEPLELSPVPAMSLRAWKRGLRGLSCPLGTRKCVSWIKFNPKKYDSMTSIGKDGLYKQLVYQFISDINDVPPEVRSRCRWHPNTGVRWTWFVRRHVATKDSDYRHRQYRFVSKWQISQHVFKTIINHSLMVKMMWFYDGKTWCERWENPWDGAPTAPMFHHLPPQLGNGRGSGADHAPGAWKSDWWKWSSFTKGTSKLEKFKHSWWKQSAEMYITWYIEIWHWTLISDQRVNKCWWILPWTEVCQGLHSRNW